MSGGTCAHTGSNGVTGADAICAAHASTDAAALPTTHTNHKAMLARGASSHPRDLAIPNKANLDVRRPDTAKTQIATSYAKTTGIKITC